MSAARRILLLAAGTASATELDAVAASLRGAGATVLVRETRDFDALLDEIAAADAIVCWR
jgi:predicted transglutaminase-like cysteine proteinase